MHKINWMYIYVYNTIYCVFFLSTTNKEKPHRQILVSFFFVLSCFCVLTQHTSKVVCYTTNDKKPACNRYIYKRDIKHIYVYMACMCLFVRLSVKFSVKDKNMLKEFYQIFICEFCSSIDILDYEKV